MTDAVIGGNVLKGAANVREINQAREAAVLTPYGGKGGGHHVGAKKAFEGAPGYDRNKAPAISNAELKRLGVDHGAVTGAQQTGYRALSRQGDQLTWDGVQKVEANALIKGGMDPRMAQATVQQAIDQLKSQGVVNPVKIPWGQ